MTAHLIKIENNAHLAEQVYAGLLDAIATEQLRQVNASCRKK